MEIHLLRRARKKRNLTQSELAKKSSISRSLYVRIETEIVSPRICILEEIFKALDLTFEEKIKILMGDEK